MEEHQLESGHPFQYFAKIRCDIFLEFFEVAIHSLLHARSIYPSDMFERRRKYGVTAWMSRLPQLNEYIYQVLENSRQLISRDTLRKMVVCIKADNGSVVENIVFELQEDMIPKSAEMIPDLLYECQDYLRALLIKINCSGTTLPSRSGCSFSLLFGCVQDDDNVLIIGEKWLILDTNEYFFQGKTEVVPIRSLPVVPFRMQVYALLEGP